MAWNDSFTISDGLEKEIGDAVPIFRNYKDCGGIDLEKFNEESQEFSIYEVSEDENSLQPFEFTLKEPIIQNMSIVNDITVSIRFPRNKIND